MDSVNRGEPNLKCWGAATTTHARRQLSSWQRGSGRVTLPYCAPRQCPWEPPSSLPAGAHATRGVPPPTVHPTPTWRRSGGVDKVRQMDAWRRRREVAYRGRGGSECGGGA